MIVFRNKGLIDLRTIDTFGVSVKPNTENPIGYFGTGMKYALAVLLREGQKVTMYRGQDKYSFQVRQDTIREEEFPIVYMNDQALPFTTSLGKNWELWMAFRELYANTVDELSARIFQKADDDFDDLTMPEEHTTFVVQGDEFDRVFDERDQIFLTTKPIYKFEEVELHNTVDAGAGWVYYRGIRVYKLGKPAMFNYNILKEIMLTEDRTLPTITSLFRPLSKAIAECDHPALIKQLLRANQNYFESSIDYNWWDIKPGECFNDVATKFFHTHTSYNRSAGALYDNTVGEKPAPQIVQWETFPMEERRKLWAALRFWAKLGIDIPRNIVLVTEGLGDKKKGTTHHRKIYLSAWMLKRDMRQIAGVVYKLYARTKPELDGVEDDDLLIDTIVDFGERLLGLQRAKVAA